jgi:penicillin-binding protein A
VERQVNRLFLFFALLFLALIAQLTYVQVYAAPKLRVNAANTRALDAEMRVQRGLIVSADGVVLAENHQDGPYYLRDYPHPELASPWLGYADLRYGRAGVERVYNAELTGETGVLAVRNLLDKITGRPQRGADLHVTIDTRVQKAAVAGLGGQVGAVVALDPRTGKVLALASSPRYDPNKVAADWKTLTQDPGRPLVDRGVQGLYPPGSIFKAIVAAAALQEGTVTPETTFTDVGNWLAGGYRVNNYGGTAYGEHTFTQAFAESINTTFAKVGVKLGADTLARYAGAFGFNARPPWALGGAKSFFPLPGAMDTAHVAQASIGQGKVLSTPLEMALVAAGIANGGVLMQPTLVEEWRDYRQTVVERPQPKVWLTPITPQTAATERTLMIEVVQTGTGTKAALPNVQVAGKTGTAEVEGGEPHAWFIGFAPADNPVVAVAVLVEHGGTGGSVAAPIARAVIAAAVGR